MKIIGLTGTIAAGKSTIVEWINELGIPTHDSDCLVHELLGPGGRAVKDVLEEFGSHLAQLPVVSTEDYWVMRFLLKRKND